MRLSVTSLSLRINGKLAAREIDAGKAVRFNRFGMWAAGEAGVTLTVREIAATAY
jgi:hypothetical protein